MTAPLYLRESYSTASPGASEKGATFGVSRRIVSEIRGIYGVCEYALEPDAADRLWEEPRRLPA